MLPIRLIGGNGNRETVARVVSEQRILKTGDQASVANGKFQGLTLSGRIEYLFRRKKSLYSARERYCRL